MLDAATSVNAAGAALGIARSALGAARGIAASAQTTADAATLNAAVAAANLNAVPAPGSADSGDEVYYLFYAAASADSQADREESESFTIRKNIRTWEETIPSSAWVEGSSTRIEYRLSAAIPSTGSYPRALHARHRREVSSKATTGPRPHRRFLQQNPTSFCRFAQGGVLGRNRRVSPPPLKLRVE
jgi:hypothetical protein